MVRLSTGFLELGNLVIDPWGSLVVTDRGANLVFRLAGDGTPTAIAGSGAASGGGDGQPALQTGLAGVRGVWFLSTGGYLLADPRREPGVVRGHPGGHRPLRERQEGQPLRGRGRFQLPRLQGLGGARRDGGRGGERADHRARRRLRCGGWCGAPAGPEWPGHPLSPRRPAGQAATDSRMARALRSRSLQVLHLVPQLHKLLADRPAVALAGVLLRAEEQIGAGSAEPSSRSRRNGPCAAASLA